MARKSAAELALAPMPQLCRLPEPPSDFNSAQAGVWHSVVATKPADWWDAASIPLLASYCKHIYAAQMVDSALDDFEPAWMKTDDGVGRFQKLSQIRAMHTEKIAMLATKMRLAQQSRYDTQKAAGQTRKHSTSRPWEADN